MPGPNGGQKQDYLKGITPVLMMLRADQQGNGVGTHSRKRWMEIRRCWAGTGNRGRGDSASPGRRRLLVGNTCPEGQWTVFVFPFDEGDMNGTTSTGPQDRFSPPAPAASLDLPNRRAPGFQSLPSIGGFPSNAFGCASPLHFLADLRAAS